MNRTISTLGVAVAAGAIALVAAACQTYDFEPVEPLAIAQVTEKKTVISKAAKPNIMLVVDQSGSMKDPIARNHPQCTSSCGAFGVDCPSGCPTRISEMKSAMADFLSNFGTTARFGLSVFPQSQKGSPAAEQCSAGALWEPISSSNDVDGELQEHANLIRSQVLGIIPYGGTPTAPTLQLLANNAALNQDDGREDFILLLTDGLPNCNTGLDTQTCTCVSLDPNTAQPEKPCTVGGNAGDSRNCMDQALVVQTIEVLKSKKIKTIVVAFGADVGNELALGPLNAMAEAGGFPRTCMTASECGAGQTCDGADASTQPETKGVCSVKFFKAANALELAEALEKIRDGIPQPNLCEFRLQAKDVNERLVVVLVNDQKVAAGPDTWNFKQEGAESLITLTGSLCQQLQEATPTSPVNVEVKLIEGI